MSELFLEQSQDVLDEWETTQAGLHTHRYGDAMRWRPDPPDSADPAVFRPTWFFYPEPEPYDHEVASNEPPTEPSFVGAAQAEWVDALVGDLAYLGSSVEYGVYVVRCRVTGVVGQVWSYGKTRRWRVVADGVRYTEYLAEHLMPIATPTPAVVVEPEAEQESLW